MLYNGYTVVEITNLWYNADVQKDRQPMAHSLVDDEIQSCIESAEPITIMLPRHQTPGRRKLNMKKKIMSMVIAAAAMALSLVGCGVDINSIGLPPNVVMEKGETQQLEIEYGTDDKAEQEKIAEAASKLTIEWTSSDEEVVTVDATGLITAVGAGEADVTASAKDVNISSTTHVKVVITPTGVEAPETLELVTNGENSKNLDAKMTPEDATEVKLAYESSDDSVATVDENGLVTAVADGECTITTYVVADAPATAETATQETAAVVTDEEKPTGGENSEATADSEAVTVPDNLDSAFGVVPDGLSATTKVTVTTKVEKIELDKTEGILNVGNTVTITATVAPEEATNPAVTWSSSDESVATVDETGKITAVATGNATITATSEDDNSVSADYELTVQQKKAATTTKNNYSGSTSAGASTAPSYTAPTQPVTPSAPAPVPAPAPAPDPAPAPAPAPDPAPAPAEPSQPSGGNSGGGNFDDGSKPEDSFGQSSGIDWTQDNSNGSLDGGCVRC